MSDSCVARHRDDYWGTAATHHERHAGEQDEHGVSLAQVLEQVEQILGIDPSRLHEGDSLHLPLSDDSFEWVVETGVLHHIRDRKRAVAEMARVVRHGLLISDTNTIGVSSAKVRKLKTIIKKLGFWDLIIWLQTKEG